LAKGRVLDTSALAGDSFELRYTAFWAICYVLAGLLHEVAGDRLSPDLVVIALLLATLGLGIYWFIRKKTRRGLSIVLALPAVWGMDIALSSIGADVTQRSFWLTYPYYVSRIDPGNPQMFEWGDNGLFLGGGWHETLLYDPMGNAWASFTADGTAGAPNLLGLRRKQNHGPFDPKDCQFRYMRELGGAWYVKTQYYGGGFEC